MRCCDIQKFVPYYTGNDIIKTGVTKRRRGNGSDPTHIPPDFLGFPVRPDGLCWGQHKPKP